MRWPRQAARGDPARPRLTASPVAWPFLSAAALVLLAAVPARGDLRVVDSVEWTASQSDVVALGTVESWRAFTGGEWVLTLVPRRGLKGGSAEGVLFLMPHGGQQFEPGERVVAFGTRRPGWGLNAVLVLREGARAVTRYGVTVTGLDEVVRALAGADALRRVAPLYLPLAGDPDDTVSLRLPADRLAEAQVHALLDSNEVGQRTLGCVVVVPFESSANIRRLQALLADRTTFPGSRTPAVCQAARHTLGRWEVPVPADACEAPTPWPFDAGFPPWGW